MPVVTRVERRYGGDRLVLDVLDEGPRRGRPVLLLHGFPQGRDCWDQVAAGLVAAGRRVLRPDQRGYSPGARPRSRAAYRLREVVEDAVAVLDAAGVRRADVVGHDLGGSVVWGLVGGRHGGRLRTATVLSTPHPRAVRDVLARSDQGLRLAYTAAFQVPVLPEAAALALRGRGMDLVLRAGGLPEPWRGRYVARMREPGALTAALGWYRALLAPGGSSPDARPLAAVPRRDVPVLHVWGPRDPVLGRAATQATRAHVRGSYRLVVLRGAGHWLPETRPDDVVRLVQEHLAAH